MAKCKYCGGAIEKGNIRCDACNRVWLEGHEAGKQDTAFEMQCLLNKFNRIISTHGGCDELDEEG